jgi:hypothetical protein
MSSLLSGDARPKAVKSGPASTTRQAGKLDASRSSKPSSPDPNFLSPQRKLQKSKECTAEYKKFSTVRQQKHNMFDLNTKYRKKSEGKVVLCLTKYHAMKMYE